MADSSGTFYSPYPGIMQTGGDDDNAFKAALIAQGDASTQRNQDSQFSAARDQLLQRDVVKVSKDTVETKFAAVVAQKDGEIRAVDRFSDIKAELAALRAEMSANTIAQLRLELSESKAEARNASLTSTLGQILSRLPPTVTG
jgi:hypothetical protein